MKRVSRIRGTIARLLGIFLLSTVCRGALDWHSGEGFRWADLSAQKNGRSGFSLLSPDQTGVTFTNRLEESASAANRVLLNGSGVAAGDFDHDGWVDLYFCGLNQPNVLYKNLGHWKFRDVTKEAGVVCANQLCRGPVFADLNGDGWLDLLVSTVGNGVLCFINNGDGTFTERTQTAGTASAFGSATMALADIDGNGTLDLYVGNNRAEDIRDRGQVELHLVKGQMVIPPALKNRLLVVHGQVLEYGEPDQLLLNDGQARFSAASWLDGRFLDEDGKGLMQPPLDWALTAAFRDLNGDGAPDIYVCNDFWTPDRIWINDGKGKFRGLERLALRCTSGSSMGVDFADLDRDGHLDFFVVDMRSRDPHLRKRQLLAQQPAALPIGAIENRPQILRNTLFHNRGDGTYEEIANFSDLAGSEWSWQPVFIDVDLDGYEDLLVTTGHARDVQDMDAERQIQAQQHSWKGYTNAVERRRAFTHELMIHMRLYPRLDTPIFAFRNTGRLRFTDATKAWGTGQPGVHHGIALADLDNDGDLDLAVNNLGSAAGVYRNETSAPRVAVRLKGIPPNTQAIGAKVTLLNGAVPAQAQEVVAGGKYLSGSDPILVFATGQAKEGLIIHVDWRSGKRSIVRRILPNRIYEIVEPNGRDNQLRKLRNEESDHTAEAAPLFKDVSDLLSHTHREEPFDDFARQRLLPKRLSQLGPGVAWFDVDSDGWDDLIVGSGRGGTISLFINDRKDGFAPNRQPPLLNPVTRDQTGILGWRRADGQTVLLAGSANYEDGLSAGAAVRQYDLANGMMVDSLPGQAASSGPLALADFDGDSDLDLLVGGRSLPARYPEPASSMLLRNTGGKWDADSENTKALSKVGMVSGAVWSDLDGDGFPELILACEWGPVRVFKNRAGKLEEFTAQLGFDKYLGLWNSVATGDLDGDGQLDIIAGNWGCNTDYGQPTAERPIRIYYGELRAQGAADIIEADYDEVLKAFAPRRRLDLLSRSLPSLQELFPTHRAFSEAPVEAVLRQWQSRVRYLESTTLATTVFFNRTNRFEARELPVEAQLAPVFAVSVADFDGDGYEDLFLSQNFFATEPETPRLDAGRGLLLLNDGKGTFRAVSGQQSGIKIYGEQRGAAVADYDQDGRVDLVVTQNGAQTRLLRNVGGKPGLRVRLRGPAGNPDAVGASLRLVFPGRFGPRREIHSGSGYWSQDSAAVILGASKQATHLSIRWPGGRVTTTPIPASVQQLTVDQEGKAR